jgi:hypothetical protein
LVVVLGVPAGATGARATSRAAAKSMSARLRQATVLEREDPGTEHGIVVSLNLRNRDELEMLLADIQNPDSPN